MTTTAEMQQLTAVPEATTGMLIRRPVAEVFEAIVDPAITARFWFTRGSDRLAPGRQVEWHWEMYGMSTTVQVKAFEENKRILIDWGVEAAPTTVEWTFEERPDATTFVTIRNFGFTGSGDEVCRAACDSTQGFTFLLSGLKALLEHGIELNLTPDAYPDAHVEGWKGA